MKEYPKQIRTTILHYSVPPVIGGVEAVIEAHAAQFIAAGMPIKIIAGRGESSALPRGVEFTRIPEMDSMHPEIEAATRLLNQGILPENFNELSDRLANILRPELQDCDQLIVHNVLTKHFNLPLTAAIFRLMDEESVRHTVAWCHDLTWTSPHSHKNVYPKKPWTLLKTPHRNVTYVAISEKRREEIADSFGCDPGSIPVIHNGVDPKTLLALSDEGLALIDRLNLWAADLILLMPVRITEAKNIEFAMQVVKELVSMKQSPRLIVTGPPDPHDSANMKYYESLRKLKSDLGLEANVHFVFESGPDPEQGYRIQGSLVSELYRVADAMFMPSHREGFGMPILEAGFIGTPIISTPVPVVQDLHLEDALIFEHGLEVHKLATQIVEWMDSKAEYQFKVRVRQNLTWSAIFHKKILPLLTGETPHEI